MPDLSLTERPRRVAPWVYDLGLGLIVALALIAVAHAALPSKPQTRSVAAQSPPAVNGTETPPAPRMASAFTFADAVPGYPVISPFGLRQLPWEEHGRLHAGVDIAAPPGTAVRAIAHGLVVRTGRDSAYGRFVEVKHAGGLSSFYAHLGSVSANVREGSAVLLGAPIGAIGNTGSSTGAHLHLEVRDRRGRPLDPTRFLGQEFADADDLPLTAASRFARKVRVAYVSSIPAAKQKLMEERKAEKAMAAETKRLSASLKAADAALARQGAVVTLNQAPLISIPSETEGRVRVVLADG